MWNLYLEREDSKVVGKSAAPVGCGGTGGTGRWLHFNSVVVSQICLWDS